MRRRWSSVIVAGVVFGACVSSRSSQIASGLPSRRVFRVLTAEEIATIPARTAYEVVRQLRPEFLRSTRGPEDSSHRLLVYVDRVLRGGVEELNNVPAALVLEIRFLSAAEATMRYGEGNTVGALDVRTGPPGR